ncbi:MAG: zinc ribbon domain-containing protein [Candidatus Lokiarchaeota archaeon]|nr:zinc ribbon domain-containing protein [Candidatus Lokiarchaeota archaeon]
MLSPSRSTQRCPKCGNENKATNYVCTFCGKRLRVEAVEKIFFWKRIEEEWTAPYPWYLKWYYLFTNSPRAFWDINHMRKKAPGNVIFWVIVLLYAFSWMALFSHFRIEDYSVEANIYWIPWMGFIAGFIFGTLYHLLFFQVVMWLFTRGANYAVDYSKKLESRFGKKSEEKTEQYQEAEMSVFSIYKGGVLQQQQAHKRKMMLCAFVPFIVIYLVEIIILGVAFPNNILMDQAGLDFVFKENFAVWAAIYAMEALIIMLWVPSLMAIAIRELSNSSTYRVVVSSYIVGVIIAIFYFFLRPVFMM